MKNQRENYECVVFIFSVTVQYHIERARPLNMYWLEPSRFITKFYEINAKAKSSMNQEKYTINSSRRGTQCKKANFFIFNKGEFSPSYNFIHHSLFIAQSYDDNILRWSVPAILLFLCICICLFVCNVNSKQYKGNVAAGCLYSIVASFIGLCGSVWMYMCYCMCLYGRTFVQMFFLCFVFFFYSLQLSGAVHTQQIISNVVGKNSYLALKT